MPRLVVATNVARMTKPKRVCIGYRPKTGNPVGQDGRLLLVYEYGFACEEHSPPAKDVHSRGAVRNAVIEQGSLL